LDIRGWQPRVLLACEPGALRGDAAANYAILRRTSVPIVEVGTDCDWTMITSALQSAAWIVDALLGTGAKGEPRAPYAELIRLANAAIARKLAVDLPSGLDCDTGLPAEVTFRADHTCTLVALKAGFQRECAQAYLGNVHVLDIGAPREVLDEALKSPGAAF